MYIDEDLPTILEEHGFEEKVAVLSRVMIENAIANTVDGNIVPDNMYLYNFSQSTDGVAVLNLIHRYFEQRGLEYASVVFKTEARLDELPYSPDVRAVVDMAERNELEGLLDNYEMMKNSPDGIPSNLVLSLKRRMKCPEFGETIPEAHSRRYNVYNSFRDSEMHNRCQIGPDKRYYSLPDARESFVHHHEETESFNPVFHSSSLQYSRGSMNDHDVNQGTYVAGTYDAQPAGTYDAQPAGTYDAQPAGTYDAQHAGTFDAQPAATQGTYDAGNGTRSVRSSRSTTRSTGRSLTRSTGRSSTPGQLDLWEYASCNPATEDINLRPSNARDLKNALDLDPETTVGVKKLGFNFVVNAQYCEDEPEATVYGDTRPCNTMHIGCECNQAANTPAPVYYGPSHESFLRNRSQSSTPDTSRTSQVGAADNEGVVCPTPANENGGTGGTGHTVNGSYQATSAILTVDIRTSLENALGASVEEDVGAVGSTEECSGRVQGEVIATYEVPGEGSPQEVVQDVLCGNVESPPVEIEVVIPSPQCNKPPSRIPIPVRTQGTSAYESVKYQGSCYSVQGRKRNTRRITIKIPVEILDKPAPNCPYRIRPMRGVGYIPPTSRAAAAPIVTKGNLLAVPKGSRTAKRATPAIPEPRSILKRHVPKGMIRPSYGPAAHQLPIYPPPAPYTVAPQRRVMMTGPGRTPPPPRQSRATGAVPRRTPRGSSVPPQRVANSIPAPRARMSSVPPGRGSTRRRSAPVARQLVLPELRAPGQIMRAKHGKAAPQRTCPNKTSIPGAMTSYSGAQRRARSQVAQSPRTPRAQRSASGGPRSNINVPVSMRSYTSGQSGTSSGWQNQLRPTSSGTPRKLPGAEGRALRGPRLNPPTPNLRPVRSSINTTAFKNNNRASNWQGQLSRPGYLSNRKLPGALGRLAKSQKRESCRPLNWN